MPEQHTQPSDGIGTVSTLMLTVAAGGIVFTLLGARPSRMCGARHSVRLEFQARQAAIEKSIADQDAQPPALQAPAHD